MSYNLCQIQQIIFYSFYSILFYSILFYSILFYSCMLSTIFCHCHRMHFPLFFNYWNFGDNRTIVTSKYAIRNIGIYLIFSTLHHLFIPKIFLSRHCHYTSYLTCHIIPHIYAPIILIFHPFLKTKTGSTHCKQTLEVWWRRRKTVHIIGIEQVQTGPDPFRHVKHSRSATATERN